MEIVLYIALYSIIFTGFIACAFSLQASAYASAKKHDEIAVSALFRALIMYHLDHSDKIILPQPLQNPSDVLSIKEGNNGQTSDIGKLTLGRLLKSYPGMALASSTFRIIAADFDSLIPEPVLVFSYALNGHLYEMHMLVP